MAFSIPNEADAFNAAQAAPDSKDIEILAAGYAGTGVVTGCAVTAQATPDMTLAVAAGTVAVEGTRAAVTAGNVTITAAHATNPRFDLVVVNSSGTKSVTAGTAAAAPVFPAVPASSVVLAAVYVPATDTAIGSNQITDKRVIVANTGIIGRTTYDPATLATVSATSATFVDLDATNATVSFVVPASGRVLVTLQGTADCGTATRLAWNLRDGSGDVGGTSASATFQGGQNRITTYHPVTGLTAGSSLTWKWGVARTEGTGNAWTHIGGVTTAIHMVVWAL